MQILSVTSTAQELIPCKSVTKLSRSANWTPIAHPFWQICSFIVTKTVSNALIPTSISTPLPACSEEYQTGQRSYVVWNLLWQSI
eukprot:207330-Rhodomonas_salina.2